MSTYRRVTSPSARPASDAIGPVCLIASVTVDWPAAVSATRWLASVVTPRNVARQANEVPGSNSTTCQTSTGSFGCVMRIWLPIPNGPSSSRSILVMDSVQSGQFCTATSAAQIFARGALISIIFSSFMPISYHQPSAWRNLGGSGSVLSAMKFWIGAAVVVLVVVLAVGLGVSIGSSGGSNSPSPIVVGLTNSPSPHPSRSPIGVVDTVYPSLSPTPTAPLSCGFGSGEWEQCAKTAVEPAFADLSTRYNLARGTELAVFSEERIDWSDSCLGVDTAGVVCLQVITPGFRFVLTGPPGTPYAEYHTDLNGHAVFVAEYATYQDVPPTHTPR